MRIDQLGLPVGVAERPSRNHLGRTLVQARLASFVFALCPEFELCVGPLSPVTNRPQISGAQKPLIQTLPLRPRKLVDAELGAAPGPLGLGLRGASLCGAQSALSHGPSLLVDTRLTEPLQGIERVAAAHGTRV